MRALVAGSTGLVGSELLRQLETTPAFEEITALTRRPVESTAGGKIHQLLIEYDRLEDHPSALAVDCIFCALGTTIRQAGSQTAFRRVDYDYPLALAKLGASQGARHFLLVSALGADPASRIFYNRVKGEVEAAISRLPLRSISIFRPSLLLGPRREFRLGEAIAKRLGFLMPGKYQPIQARDVAAAMVRSAIEDAPGVRIIESAEMRSTDCTE